MKKRVYYNATTMDVVAITDIKNTFTVFTEPYKDIEVSESDMFPTVPYSRRYIKNNAIAFEQYVPKPTTLTPRQARLALLNAGLLDELELAIANDRTLQIWWEYSLDIKRDNPELLAFATSYGLTSEQLDALFEQGALL